MRSINLFLDDCRNPPNEHWTLARTAEEAKALFEDPEVVIEYCSLDHDLGECADCENSFPPRGYRVVTNTCRHRMTGYDLVKWMAEHNKWPLHKPHVHSANPVGKANMQATIDRYFVKRS